jgi:hypothetical protein
VQTAEISNQLVAGTKMEMIRVPENHRRADLTQVDGIERLYCRERPNGHERRRLDDAVRGRERSRSRGARLAVDRELEWCHVLGSGW